MVDFSDSQYRFTDPIRVFKANDPLYFEVQNIPLKQLQENDQWLKDQIQSLAGLSDDGVSRSTLNELRPYVDGNNNVVKVKPGRFTARINDAYNITPLQVLDQVLGDGAADGSKAWLAGGSNETILRPIIDRFKQNLFFGLNGLVERAFTYPAFISDRANSTAIGTTPKIAYLRSLDTAYGQPPYPQAGMVLWNRFQDLLVPGYPGGLPNPLSDSASNEYAIRQFDDGGITIGFSRLAAAETAFIKKWRGVARTAVVDIPEELSITIPAFEARDHFYIDESGQKIQTPATQRIDLLFVYSKPVDTSSTTIAKFVNGQPTTINTPQLGIVYGAGVGVSFRGYTQRTSEVLGPNGVDKDFPLTDDSTLPDGTIKMLSHYGDESGGNTGFNLSGITVKGSFPSPDDLMNFSPLLDEELTGDSLFLVGQTILPLAYIIVKQSASINLDGTPVLTSNDVIDIRPFLRTTELSYNERAGLAASIPSISLANPVVSQAELMYELRKTYNDILTRIPVIEPPTDPGNGGGTQPPTTVTITPRLVGTGTLYGGYDYGVEGALAAFILKINPGLTKEQIKTILKQNYGYGNNAAIPDQPSWEIAKWVLSRSSLLEPGNFPNDRINISTMTPTEFGCYSDRNKTRRIKFPGLGGWAEGDAVQNTTAPFRDILTNTVFVKKTIVLDRSSVPWMSDYNVNVQFLNCVPLAGHKIYNSPTGVWIDKRADRFTIFVAWAGRESFPGNGRGGATWAGKNPSLDNNESYFSTSTWLREGNDFAGFVVMNKDLCEYQAALSTNISISNTNMAGQNSSGVCIYPTVRFEVVGIPEGYSDPTQDFTAIEPTLTLN